MRRRWTTGGTVMLLCMFGCQTATGTGPGRLQPSPWPDFVEVEHCVEGMGAVWVLGADHPQQSAVPRMGYSRGRLIVLEFQFPVDALLQGRTWVPMKLEKTTVVDHIDVLYHPGHGGFDLPHYDVRFYYVPHREHQFGC